MRRVGRKLAAGSFSLTTLVLAALCVAPLCAVMVAALFPDEGGLAHMAQTSLVRYLSQSAILAVGVGILALLMGTYSAWYVTIYDFPLRRYLQWALLLPLAVPAYVSGMAYGDLLDVAGPIQQWVREVTGKPVGGYWFPDIRSPGGAILVLASALYPYVYILARLAFRSQCASLFESAYLLGAPPRHWFRLVGGPVARPALAVGLALVLMETLADFGTVSLFGVSSMTTAIYRAWFGLVDPLAAAKLAAILLSFIMLAIWGERYSRREIQYHTQGGQPRVMMRIAVTGWRGWWKMLLCAIPFILGFVIPLGMLLDWATHSNADWHKSEHWNALFYSLAIASCAGVAAVLISLLFAYYLRLRQNRVGRGVIRLALFGYAVPGSVIAVGIFIPMVWLDRSIADWVEAYSGTRPGLLITGSIAAIVIACTIRFLAVAAGSVEAALNTIPRRVDDAGRLLGSSSMGIFGRLHLRSLGMPLLVAGFMVFTDTLKELPATLLLRPFNVNTLAIHTYELAKDGWLVQASIPALFMISLSLIAVLLLAWQQRDRAVIRNG